MTGRNLKSLPSTYSLWIKEITQDGAHTKIWKGAKKDDDLEYIFKYDPEDRKKA